MSRIVRPRIGIAGLNCECCTFSPLPTRAEEIVLLSGDELLRESPFLAMHPGVEFVPLRRARAIPGGAIEPGFHEAFVERLLADLSVGGPWDGLFLHLHGAAKVRGRDDLEGELLETIRGAVGPDCLLAASYDLHGNVSERVASHLDILSAYRSAPHVDIVETILRACALLVRCIEEGLKPRLAFLPVPILLPGEMTSTEQEPAAALYASLPGVIEKHGLLDASILIGYAWADEPRASGSVVTVGLDEASTRAAADELGRAFWAARKRFAFGVSAADVDASIRAALAHADGPVLLSDSGDNPTAGGAGDLPFVLKRLLALSAEDTLVAGIADAPAVAACFEAGAGAELDLELGGKLDPVHGEPLDVRARVVSLHETESSGEPRGRGVLLRIGGVSVIVTERRSSFHRLADFTRLDLDPRAFHLIVVKMGYLVPELAALARAAYLALSPGAVNQEIVNLGHERIGRPMFPFDPGMRWKP